MPCAKNHATFRAARAYRRPITDEDLQIPLARYRDGASKAGARNGRLSFDSGIELAVRSILVSPKFLFRFEGQPETAAPNTAYRITDVELASRLSFFLWSSIPDDELLNVAEKKTLHDPVVLDRQVRRMLADPRSEALVSNFAGQWLQTAMCPGSAHPELLFHFDDNLRQAFERETALFATVSSARIAACSTCWCRLYVPQRASLAVTMGFRACTVTVQAGCAAPTAGVRLLDRLILTVPRVRNRLSR